MTSEGGGAVAFPVMTLALGIKPSVARDFSLMIQSCGQCPLSTIVNILLHDCTVATDRDDGGLLHHHVDADKTGEALSGVLQRWRLCWHYLW